MLRLLSSRLGRLLTLGLVGLLVLAYALPVEAQRRRRRRRGGPRSNTGTLVIQTQSEGAEVLVDEELVGRTPIDPVSLEAGSHTVRVRLPGYTEFSEVVQIDAGQPTELPVEMLEISYVLRVASTPPAARVFIDEQYRGETGEEPLEIELLDGTHQLRLHLYGYREVNREIQAQAGQSESMSFELEQMSEEELGLTTEWYEDPWIWVGVGLGAAAIAVGVGLAVFFFNEANNSQVNDFCRGDASGDCAVRFASPLIDPRYALVSF